MHWKGRRAGLDLDRTRNLDRTVEVRAIVIGHNLKGNRYDRNVVDRVDFLEVVALLDLFAPCLLVT